MADSLSALEVPALRSATRIADIGAGAGFPGLPLALALPAASVDLVEASARKCAVIARLATAAGLEAVGVRNLRAEELAARSGREAYLAVTARALAPLAVVMEYASPLLQSGGVLVAWKGVPISTEEAAAARASARTAMEIVDVLQVKPFSAARSRHLYVLAKAASTPTGLPRRPGMARKRPLT